MKSLRAIALSLLVLAVAATSIGCTATAAGKVSTAEMPAPAADPVVDTATSWSDFLDWATSSSKEGTSMMDTFSADASAYDVVAVEDDARSLYDWADGARQWLAANPPEACYAAVHASYDRSMAHYQKVGSLLMHGVTAKNLTASTAEMKLATIEVKGTTALIQTVTC